MDIKGVVHTTNVLYAKPFSFQSAEDLENGFFVTKGNLVTGETEVYEGLKPATANLTQKAYLVAHPATSYDTRADSQNEEKFINVRDLPYRVYDLEPNNKVSITNYTIDGDVAVGNFVTIADDSYKLVASATATMANGFVGKIERIEDMGYFYHIGSLGTDIKDGVAGIDGRVTMVVISVIKNG
jgi:hypothetical protein